MRRRDDRMNALPRPRRRNKWAWRAALIAASTAVAAGWWWSEPQAMDAAHPGLSVSSDGATGKPAEGAEIVVTLRWGVTDHRTGRSEIDGPSSVNWDGFLALDCGRIERVEPLAFELDAPIDDDPVAHTDFLGEVVRGAGGDQRVYWKSSTQAGWDGLRVAIQACDPRDGPTRARKPASMLTVKTAQRDYTARLDWSANDFVALSTERRGQRLEVHINVQQNERSLRGARVTANF